MLEPFSDEVLFLCSCTYYRKHCICGHCCLLSLLTGKRFTLPPTLDERPVPKHQRKDARSKVIAERMQKKTVERRRQLVYSLNTLVRHSLHTFTFHVALTFCPPPPHPPSPFPCLQDEEDEAEVTTPASSTGPSPASSMPQHEDEEPRQRKRAATQPVTEREHASKSTRSQDKAKTVIYMLCLQCCMCIMLFPDYFLWQRGGTLRHQTKKGGK